MLAGHYVRCPIVLEENDKYFPRSFILAKITQINEMSGEVSVKLFDFKNSKRFYAHAFEKQKFPMLTLSDGDTLYLAGQPYKLDVRLGLQNSIRRSGQTVFMELADDTPVMKQKLYHKLLQSLGKKLFPASLSRMQPLFDGLALPDPVLKQRVMRSRWGSCMPLKGIVTMNTYLAIMPEEIIDHVMLHELCHFLQPNHSRHFYDAMTIRMPDWKARRQAMTKYLPYCV